MVFIKFNFFRIIDNLIFDPMNQILINLELYFKIYNYLIFMDFSRFFYKFYEFQINLFELNSLK